MIQIDLSADEPMMMQWVGTTVLVLIFQRLAWIGAFWMTPDDIHMCTMQHSLLSILLSVSASPDHFGQFGPCTCTCTWPGLVSGEPAVTASALLCSWCSVMEYSAVNRAVFLKSNLKNIWKIWMVRDALAEKSLWNARGFLKTERLCSESPMWMISPVFMESSYRIGCFDIH